MRDMESPASGALRFTAVLDEGTACLTTAGLAAGLTLAVGGTSAGSILPKETAILIFCWSEGLIEAIELVRQHK